MTRRSLNEVEVMVKKAAVGSGLPPGIATDLGTAARIACAAGDDGVGMALAAMAPTGDVVIDGATVTGPLALAAPVAIDLALAGRAPVTLAGDGLGLVAHYAAGLPLQVDLRDGVAVVVAGSAVDIATVDGVDVAPQTWAQLEPLAAKTYVPETEASRASGAGAGEIDND